MKFINFPFIAIIKIYKYLVSPLFPNSCKFEPTCSNYAIECFTKFNFFKAFFKTLVRILKCNPWFNTGGYDYPSKKEIK